MEETIIKRGIGKKNWRRKGEGERKGGGERESSG